MESVLFLHTYIYIWLSSTIMIYFYHFLYLFSSLQFRDIPNKWSRNKSSSINEWYEREVSSLSSSIRAKIIPTKKKKKNQSSLFYSCSMLRMNPFLFHGKSLVSWNSRRLSVYYDYIRWFVRKTEVEQ